MPAPPTILLGTVAIEPARWTHVTPDDDGRNTIVLAEWMDAIAEAGFDGIEVWERHVLDATAADRHRTLEHRLPIEVWNSYVSLDVDDDHQRNEIAERVADSSATAIKYNVGNDLDQVEHYADRVGRWLDMLPAEVRLLCECHHGISIAEDPAIAAAIFDRAGSPARVQAIVHTHEADDELRRRFDAYGERITHVHINHLDFTTMSTPPLGEIEDRFAARVELLGQLGFDGSWTIEFVHGLLTDDDRPDVLTSRAADDLTVARRILDQATT